MSVTNAYKQTIVCMKKEKKNKKEKKRTNIMSYLCCNKTSVLSSNDRFKFISPKCLLRSFIK
jgi:hypothetical protein